MRDCENNTNCADICLNRASDIIDAAHHRRRQDDRQNNQQLPGGELTPAFEIMHIDNAIANMIREGKMHQMDNMIYTNSAKGILTMKGGILRLYRKKRISR